MKRKLFFLLPSLAVLALAIAGCVPGKETALKPSPSAETPKAEAKLTSYDDARAEAKKEGKLLMLKFEADWCGPCRDMTKAMESDIVLVEEMKNYKVVHVDIDDAKNKDIVAKFYPDSGIPFVIILRPEDESRVTDLLGFDSGSVLARELKAARDKA